MTKECYDVVLFIYVARISACTATKASGTGGDTTPQRPDRNGEGGSFSSYRDGEYGFWMEIHETLEDAGPGDTVKVNAKGYDRLPWPVMEALREADGVTLQITWNGGEDIIIPSEAALSEQSRVYYPLSYLEGMTFEVKPEAPAADPDKINPETSGQLEAAAPSAVDSFTDPVADPQSGPAETPELAGEGIEQSLPSDQPAETPELAGEDVQQPLPDDQPAEAVTAAPAGETGASGLLIAGGAAALAAAGGGFWYWKRRTIR